MSAIVSENKIELLGIVLDSKLSFEDHIINLCKKASQKFKALARVAPYMYLKKKENSGVAVSSYADNTTLLC